MKSPIETWAEAKRSGAKAQPINQEQQPSDVPKAPQADEKQSSTSFVSDDKKVTEVEWVKKKSEKTSFMVWLDVILLIIGILLLGYLVYVVRFESNPKRAIIDQMQSIKAAIEKTYDRLDEIASRAVEPQVKLVEVPKIVYRTKVVEVERDDWKTAQVDAFYRLQKYLVDRFFDTPLPTGHERSLVICENPGDCKSYQRVSNMDQLMN